MAGPVSTSQRRSGSVPEPAPAGAVEPLVASAVEPLPEYVSACRDLDALESGAPTPEAKAEFKEISRKLRNCCGQYALATVCRAHGQDVVLEDAIAATNPFGIFTGPYAVTGFLKKNGIVSTEHNKSNEETLFEHVSSGRTAILLVNSEVENSGTCPHWVVVSGVSRDANGQMTWQISDAANMSGSDNFVGEISHERLMKAWHSPLTGFGKLAGFKNYWIGVDEKPGLFSRPLSTMAASSGAHLINQFANGTARSMAFTRGVFDRLRFPRD